MSLAVELVTIGNEILNGFTINTNAAVIGQALLSIGLKVSSQRTLPDDSKLLKAGLQHSLNSADLIICTGGLGPTCDDQTRQIIAELFDCSLKFEPKIAAYLHDRYHDRQVSIEDQAMIPEKAEYILNEIGTASALVFDQNNKLIIFLPGVPSELEHFMLTKIIPILKNKYDHELNELHQQCNFMQLSESQIDPILRQLAAEYPQVEFGIYPSLGTLSVHIISRLANAQQNLNYQQPIKQKIIAAFKDYFYSDQTNKLEDIICQICAERDLFLGLRQDSADLNLGSKLSPVLAGMLYLPGDSLTTINCDVLVTISGIPIMPDNTTVYSTDLKIELQTKNNNLIKTHNVRGSKTMLIKRAENLALFELYKNLCYTT